MMLAGNRKQKPSSLCVEEPTTGKPPGKVFSRVLCLTPYPIRWPRDRARDTFFPTAESGSKRVSNTAEEAAFPKFLPTSRKPVYV